MSAIALQPYTEYIQPTFGSRPTKVSRPVVELPLEPASRPAKDPRLTTSHFRIDRLAALQTNWDGNGSTKPNEQAVEHARQFLEDAFRDTANVGWQSPLIGASEDGEIVLEWWNGVRKLTIYVGANQSTYLKSWGPHIVEDMEDGTLAQTWDPALWVWLFE